MNIDRFKNDHNTMLSAVEELRRLVQGGVAKNADAITSALVSMSGAIKLHLSAEDSFLYPTLAKSKNPEVAKVGAKFQSEMGGIAAAYGAFAGKWNVSSKVAADPDGFKDNANAIFKALHQRIQAENQELYPLAESA